MLKLFFSSLVLIACASLKLDVNACKSTETLKCNNVNDSIEYDSCDSITDPAIASLVSSVSNEETIFIDDFYTTYYFKNLTNNFGYNVKGSCTYVAFDMLLSFWDTYWCDSFIPESYDMVTNPNK